MIQQHGGNIAGLENILDLSANINPLGIPEGVKIAISEGIPNVERYPDPFCTELRERIALYENTAAENIVCGNGADDLIFRIVHAFNPKKALLCAPTFTEYRRALSEAGCEICEYLLREENGFDVGEDFGSRLDSSFDICFVCNPNNPTGRLIAPEVLGMLAEKCEKFGVLLVCDECFLGFVQNGAEYSLRNHFSGSSVILRAFTKLYAMPGIRLGYAVCGSSVTAGRIQDSGQFWSVSSLAQRAGVAAVGEREYVRRTVEYIAEEREFLTAELRRLDVKVFGSEANYLLFRSQAGLCEKLLAEGILIRDCSGFTGLTDGFYRTAVRTRSENMQLINALRRCLNG